MNPNSETADETQTIREILQDYENYNFGQMSEHGKSTVRAKALAAINQHMLQERIDELNKLDDQLPDWWKDESTPGTYTEKDMLKLVKHIDKRNDKLKAQLKGSE